MNFNKTIIDFKRRENRPAGFVAGAGACQAPGCGITPAPGAFITDLEGFFRTAQLPDTFRLDTCSVVTDMKLFVGSHIDMIRGHEGQKGYLPYYERLILLKNFIENGINTGRPVNS